MCLNSVFTQTTYTQDRFRHVHHMEIIPFRLTAHVQPDLSLSVFLERFSVCSSETSCIIRLFQFGVSKPLGTHVDRSSAVDHHQTLMGSWVPFPGYLFLGPIPSWFLGSWNPIPWLFVHGFLGPNPWLFSFLLHFIHSATTLAQVYDIDFVFNRVNVLLVRLGIYDSRPPPRSPSCRGLLVTNSLVRDDPIFRTRSTLCLCQVFHCLCLCC